MSNTYKASNALLVERVNKLEQQRDELLEALKDAKSKLEWFVESYPHDLAQPQSEFFAVIDSAITKAEAAE